MIKRIFLLFAACLFMQCAFAMNSAQIHLNIKGSANHGQYYLCLYDIGCLNMSAGLHGKTFQTSHYDLGNILQFVIMDIKTLREHRQPSNNTCDIKLKPNQSLIISGDLVLKKNKASIRHLRCRVSKKSA